MKSDIGGIILCGGKSTRFGSNKGVYKFFNKELIRYSIDLLKKFTEEVVIVGPEILSDTSVRFVQDIFTNCGPMGGIHSGLKHSNYSYNIVLSCDIPFINEDILNKLLQSNSEADIQIFQTPDHRYHPLIGLYHKKTLNNFETNLKAGQNKLIDFVLNQNHSIIKISEIETLKGFVNINYLHDIQKYEN